jgi:hypothetical protein
MRATRSVSILLGFLGTLIPAVAAAVNVPFTAILNGAQEVPPRETPGSWTGSGALTGDPGAYILTYTVTYSGLLGAIASPFAHIHNAPFGTNGPIVHDLDGANVAPIAGSTSGTITGDWRFDDATRPLTDALAAQFLAGNLYFNIHTTQFTPGEIRGQLSPIPEPSAVLLMALGVAGLALTLRRRRVTPQT